MAIVKLKLLHVDNEHSMNWTGGIEVTLQQLAISRLGDRVDMTILPLVKVWEALPSLKPDLIVVHAASSWRRLATLARLKRFAPVFINEHHYCANFEVYQVKSLRRFHTMLRLAYGLADGVITASVAQKHWALDRHLVSPAKLHAIPFCRLLEPFFAVPLRQRSPDRPVILGAYGRLCHQKGFDVLIAAMRQVADLPVQLHLGGTGVDGAALKQAAADLPAVQFLGRIDDVPKFLTDCDAVVIPSRWEPWGTVCLETKAAARSVIISNVDGLTEQVQDCGWMVPADNPDALAAAIRTVVAQSPDTLQTMGAKGRASVVDAWDNYVARWEAVVNTL